MDDTKLTPEQQARLDADREALRPGSGPGGRKLQRLAPRAWRPMVVQVDGVQYEVDRDLKVYTSDTYQVALGKTDSRGQAVTRTKIGTRRRVKDPELVDRVIAAAIGRAA